MLFADESTGALNSGNSDAVLDVFTKLHCNGQSIIMVTHDKKSALRGNRIIYLKDGQIFGECDLEDFPAGDEKTVGADVTSAPTGLRTCIHNR